MQDIRLVGNDGEYLNLETQNGDKYRLVLDDSLRSAVKRDGGIQLDAISISPREIQDAVRAGATAAEVAEKHAAPLDYVEKFALTVVDEIGHIIASARSVRIAVAADRYSEATQIEFGEVISERITNFGGKNTTWSAVKLEGLPWQVSVTFETNAGTTTAVWSFDQRKLVLSPENSLAVKFSGGEQASSSPTPKLRPMENAANATQVIELPTAFSSDSADDSESGMAIDRTPTLSVVSSIGELTRASLDEASNQVENLGPAEVIGDVEERFVVQRSDEASEGGTKASKDQEDAPLSATADLLEALRKKRSEASKMTSEVSVEQTIEPVEAAKIEEISPAPITPAAKKGRPSMPSWDEIVFGTKTDD